jgi:1,4-dihydroxy-2-naphthoate octaprenyltransferase
MKKIGFWFKNSRYMSLPQSVMPAVLAISMALQKEDFSVLLSLAAFVGIIFAHLGMNLADDYFDYKHKSSEARQALEHQGIRARIAKYEYLTSRKATPKQLLRVIIIFLAIAASLGAIVLYYRGITVVVIAAITFIMGFFYSCPPLKLSYRGLGDLTIGIIFGPLLMIGIYFASCGQINNSIVISSLPVGFLVMNVIFTHSILDRKADEAVGKKTFATLLDKKSSLLICSFLLNFLPFLFLLIGVVVGYLHWAYLVVLVVLPRGVWLFWSLKKFLNDEQINLHPAKWLGRMENWQQMQQAGIDWFMIRWYCCRNIISTYCELFVLINIILALWL